jgi:hypothetical protein
LNEKNRRRRRNFDLAHELFHLLTWDLFDAGIAGKESEEKLADTFAANLLMPAGAIRAAVSSRRTPGGKLSLPALFEMARQFDVSVEALIWRVHALYGGSSATKKKTEALLGRARSSVWALGDREQEPPPRRPARFFALAMTALRRGEMSAGRFAEYVGISRQQAVRYVEQEPDGDEEIELPAS